jgi:hypothetical protein
VPEPKTNYNVTCSLDQVLFMALNKLKEYKADKREAFLVKRLKREDGKVNSALLKMLRGGSLYWQGLKDVRDHLAQKLPRAVGKDGSVSHITIPDQASGTISPALPHNDCGIVQRDYI